MLPVKGVSDVGFETITLSLIVEKIVPPFLHLTTFRYFLRTQKGTHKSEAARAPGWQGGCAPSYQAT